MAKFGINWEARGVGVVWGLLWGLTSGFFGAFSL